MQDVDAAEDLDGVLDDMRDLRRVGEVAGREHGIAAERAGLGDRLLPTVSVDVGGEHARALTDHLQHGRAADPLRRARDDAHLLLDHRGRR